MNGGLPVFSKEIAMGDRVSTVRIDSDLASKAKVIAGSRDISIGEYISELIREHIDDDWTKVVKSLDKGGRKEGGSK
jgi:hypothetical protein